MNKERKNEINEELSEATYVTRKVTARILVGVLIMSAIIGIFSIGGKFIQMNADRIIHKQSITYNEGVLDDLAKYKLEMIRAESEVEKKAIANVVVDRFANYDESKIETYDLRAFLKDCRNLDIENY